MKGDKIVLEDQHYRVGKEIAEVILPRITASKGKYAIAVAGESGSGKSTIATTLADVLEARGIPCIILQQDDYYVYPPITNDQMRRRDSDWNGIREVRLELLDQIIKDILDGNSEIAKPLVIYEEDRIDTETINTKSVRVVIAEGSYTAMLKNVNTRIFIDRTYLDTKSDREKRARYQAELDEFTENILRIEHEIISAHKARADIIITKEYKVSKVECTSSF